MQDILATYLFQQKKCPLPGIGSLRIKEESAIIVHGEKMIQAPTQSIQFSKQETGAEELVEYIAAEENISADEARDALKTYCRTLKFMGTQEEVPLSEAGIFSVSADGNLKFTPVVVTRNGFNTVVAEKVLRPNDTHNILVGDTETTNTVMTEYYKEEDRMPVSRWWIWALVLLAVGAVAVAVYFNMPQHNAMGGNIGK